MRARPLRLGVRRRLRRAMVRWRAWRMAPDAAWKQPLAKPPAPEYEVRGRPEALAEACRRLDVERVGELRYGYRRKSVGAEVRSRDGQASWIKLDGLRAASPDNAFRTSESEAGAFTNIPKPSILRNLEWNSDGVHWRALQMTLAPAPAVLERPWLTGPLPSIDDGWLAELRRVMDRLAGVPTRRRIVDPNYFAQIIRRRFGRRAPSTIDEWRTAHGDLNWSNLTAPKLTLLDWETWGVAPRGFDAAALLSYSFADQDLFRRIERVFADDLDTASGVVSRLFHYGQWLSAIESGRLDPRQHRLVEAEARRLLRR